MGITISFPKEIRPGEWQLLTSDVARLIKELGADVHTDARPGFMSCLGIPVILHKGPKDLVILAHFHAFGNVRVPDLENSVFVRLNEVEG
ncbi:MAG: hypothetical protein PHI12_10870 [Dehalococcoidales bacterium]|nr:hypothetical protein [Dehalococcoidales bacterium]